MTKQERIEKETAMLAEMRAHEDELHRSGIRYIAGIDEVGRGPLAGPVYAACVVLPEGFDVIGINDSKKVSAKKRDELDAIIRERAEAYGIGVADCREIDEINILNATRKAMMRAVDIVNEKLAEKEAGAHIDHLLIDAVSLDTDIPQESIIKGDAHSLSIAAASIVAKVARDRFMDDMEEQYPGYGFAANKGYGTAAHYDGLRELGPCPIHRMTFLRKFFEQENGENSSMSGGSKKVYAVRKGRETGIFETWDECKRSVDGFSGAEYKSFKSQKEACEYLGIEWSGELSMAGVSSQTGGSGSEGGADARPGIAAYVDGSYDIVSGRYSCGVVILNGGVTEAEISRAYDDAAAAAHRNVAGEVMGATEAVSYCLEKGYDHVTIYHDYEGIGKWGTGAWKANTELTKNYKSFIREASKRMRIDFVKVRAHTGVRYNEIADKLAKRALSD